MLDLGWPELLVVALVLIIVVGPKDLPGMLRTFGRTTKRLRSMAGEFRSQFDEALKEAELGDVADVLNEAKQLNPTNILKDVVDPIREAGKDIKSDLDKAMREPDKPKVDNQTETPLAGDPAQAKTATAKAKSPSARTKAAASGKAKTTASKPAAAKKPTARKSTARKPAGKTTAAKSNGAAKTTATAKNRSTAKKTSTATRSRSKTAANKTTTKSSGDTA